MKRATLDAVPLAHGATVAAAILLAAAMGAALVSMPLLTTALIIAACGATILISLPKKHLLAICTAVYALFIIYPAFLPNSVNESPEDQLVLDFRGVIHAAIIVGLLGIGCLLWWISDVGIAELFRPQFMVIMVYCFLILLSLTYSPGLTWSVFGFVKLFALLPPLIVILGAGNPLANVLRLVNGIMGAIVIVALMYWIDVIRGAGVVSDGRLVVSWLHPNQGGLITAVLFVSMTVRTILYRTPYRLPLLPIGLAVLGGATSAAMASKSSLGGAAIALTAVMLVILVRRPGGGTGVRTTLVVGGLGVVGCCLALFTSSGIVAHLQSYSSNEYIDPTQLTGRVPIWLTAIDQTTSDPFTLLLGHGYLSTFAIGLESQFWQTEQAHNSFVQTFFDLGTAGLIAVIALFATTVFRTAQAVLTSDCNDDSWRTRAELFAILLLFSVVSFTEDIMGGIVEQRTVVFLAIALAALKMTESRTAKLPPSFQHA